MNEISFYFHFVLSVLYITQAGWNYNIDFYKLSDYIDNELILEATISMLDGYFYL